MLESFTYSIAGSLPSSIVIYPIMALIMFKRIQFRGNIAIFAIGFVMVVICSAIPVFITNHLIYENIPGSQLLIPIFFTYCFLKIFKTKFIAKIESNTSTHA